MAYQFLPGSPVRSLRGTPRRAVERPIRRRYTPVRAVAATPLTVDFIDTFLPREKGPLNFYPQFPLAEATIEVATERKIRIQVDLLVMDL